MPKTPKDNTNGRVVKASLGKMRRVLREQRGQIQPFAKERVKMPKVDYFGTPTLINTVE